MSDLAQVSANAPSPIRLTSIEERLGPARSRFFGHGFRGVRYDVNDVRTTVAGAALELTARVNLTHPRQWSSKGANQVLRPHLSSLDAMILGCATAQFAAAVGFGLTPHQAARVSLRDMRVAAGSSPTEEFTDLNLTLAAAALPDRRLSFDCRLAGMRIRGTSQLPDDLEFTPGDHRHDSLDEVLGAAADRYYGHGFATRSQRISDIEIDRGGTVASAWLHVTDDDLSGAEAACPASEIDVFVTALQLAQLMLYDLDDLDRSDSETLWMRSIRVSLDPARRVAPDGVPVVTELRDARVVELESGRWRTTDIVGDAGGISLRVGVTHKLPDVADAVAFHHT